MSIDLSRVTGISDSRGVITEIKDSLGRVIWAASRVKPAILKVAKQTVTTMAGETTYENETFILLNIYPKKKGTVKVTYGGLTKTVTDTSGVDEPNAVQVFFGTFNGVSDNVTTPASGEVAIEGAYRGYGRGSYTGANGKSGAYLNCVTGAVDFGEPEYIGFNTFMDCTDLAFTQLPDSITEIAGNAFNGCVNLALTSLPKNLVKIGNNAFRDCEKINLAKFPDNLVSIEYQAFEMKTNINTASKVIAMPMYGATITLPSTLTSIGSGAFSTGFAYNSAEYWYGGYIKEVIVLATTPPEISSDDVFGHGFTLNASSSIGDIKLVVPKGCTEAYTSAGWTRFDITEAS